jgi:hypothetical protein
VRKELEIVPGEVQTGEGGNLDWGKNEKYKTYRQVSGLEYGTTD